MSPPLLWAVVGLLLGGLIGHWIFARRARTLDEANKRDAGSEADRIVARARAEAESLKRAGELAGREEGYRLREGWEKEEARRRLGIERTERRQEARAAALRERAQRAGRRDERLSGLGSELDGRLLKIAERERDIERREAKIQVREAELGGREAEFETLVVDLYERNAAVEAQENAVRARLERLGDMTAGEARRTLVDEIREEAEAEAERSVRETTRRAREEANAEARRIVSQAIQRLAVDCTEENTVSVVTLPSDEMKGRIIGREGRNIRTFEKETGVNVVIDDTPGAVVLSCYDPRRREVARLALERLVEDGRIQPARIEDTVGRARSEVEGAMKRAAEEALSELGIHGVAQPIQRRLGMLRFRTSYGQNQLRHSREVAWLAGTMAAELGLEVALAKRAGLLHDIGKGFAHDREGTHVELGYRLCRRHGEHPVVLNAIKAHHDEEEHMFPESFLVTAADAISGSRPGARREMAEDYVRRLEKLEEIAMDHRGVESCFAVHAGREIRVMVQPSVVSDGEIAALSKTIARRLEAEHRYPGKIKVVIVRETRAEEYAH